MMNKKLVIGGVVLLLVVGGGAFLLLGSEPKKSEEELGSDTIPTQWSQAGDYEIKEVAGPPSPGASAGQSQQTVVTNSKAGFSFKVPEGWKREDREGEIIGEYVFNMLSPDAAFQKDEAGNELAILGGCTISLETERQKSSVESIRIDIANIERNPSESQKILEIDGRVALQTDFFPPPSKYLETFGETITIVVPLEDELVISFATRYLPVNKTKCTQTFREFVSNISIEK